MRDREGGERGRLLACISTRDKKEGERAMIPHSLSLSSLCCGAAVEKGVNDLKEDRETGEQDQTHLARTKHVTRNLKLSTDS